MRQHSDELAEVLAGSFERELAVNVFNGSDRMLTDVRFESWQLDADLGRGICTQGSGTIVHPSKDGSSVVPVGTEGILSPFRARVEPVMTIRAGGFEESVSLGTFRVSSVPSASDSVATYDGRELVVASRVGVKFDSLEADVERWGFQSPEQSKAGASAFAEIRRLTGMPVEQTVTDVAVPSLKVWEAKQGGRLDAIVELGRVLGGAAVVNSRGAWEIVPDVIGEPVATLRLGAAGTVLDVADEIDTDTVYNEVVGTFEDVNGKPIYAVERVSDGALSADGPYGPHTRYYSSDLVKTQTQADAAVKSVLAQSIGSQQYDVQIQCHANPLVEIGDVVALEGWKRPLVGQLRRIGLSNTAYMSVTLRVARRLT